MIRKLFEELKVKRAGLKSPPLSEALYQTLANNRTLTLAHSKFNVNWLNECGITPSLIVDLGSFDGGDSLRFKNAFPSATVLTVEADPERFSIVQANTEAAGVIVLNRAICEVNEKVDWFSARVKSEVQSQGSMFRHSERYRRRYPFVSQADDPIKIEGSRVDTLLETQGLATPDLLHMDIEGAEYLALKSLGEIRPRLIYLELRKKLFEGGAEKGATHDLLSTMGYQLLLNLGTDRLYRRV